MNPKTLDEAVDVLLPKFKISDLKDMSENSFVGRCHHGLGAEIRNNWGLWGSSALAKHFNKMGIHHADDMSGIILVSVYRKMTGKERKLEEQIKHYQDYWKKNKQQDEE